MKLEKNRIFILQFHLGNPRRLKTFLSEGLVASSVDNK